MPDIKKCVKFFNETKSKIKPVKRSRGSRGDRKKTDNGKKRPAKAKKVEKKQ